MRLYENLLNDPVVRHVARALINEVSGGAGQVRLDGRWVRLDATVATAFTARQLEHIKAQTYDVKKSALKSRIFLPVSHEAHPGAQVISYDQWDSWGEAEIADTYSKDAPRVDAEKRNFPTKVFALRSSYGYDIQDLRAIQMSGSMLNVKRALQARRSVEAKLDRVAAKGDARIGRTGFVNSADVPTFTGAAPTFDFSTPPQTIFRFLNAVASEIVTATNQVESPNAILLPTALYQIVTSNTFGSDTPVTILEVWLRTNPYGVRFADQWTELDGAGAGGTDRLVVYKRDPAVAEIEIPQEYEEFPPEMRGLEFLIQAHMRTAGTVIRYPKAIRYADGTYDVSAYEAA